MTTLRMKKSLRYLKPAQLRALPLAPIVTVDETKVELPRNRGIIGLSVKSLNDRANRKRLAAYEAKIRDGWKGLKLLAEGDSWFLYPILLKDIVDNLSNDYAVYSVAAAGDTLENMLRGTAELEAKIKEHQFNGMLLSAGGNDIAGDLLRSYLTTNKLPPKPASDYLNDRFDAFISGTREKLGGLFDGLTSRFPDLKIFCHGYDWPFPRRIGLWLEPAMLAQQVPEEVQPAVLKLMIDRYYEMLGSLAEKYRDRVFVADCRGSVGAITEWFDELHPFNAGYTRAAGRFRSAINQVFGISRSVRAPTMGAMISWHPRDGAKGVTGSAEFDLGSVVSVGRMSGLDIAIDDERVSRNHVRLEIRQGNVVFTDLNTTNGTLLEGRRRIGATVWKPGEKLQIGDHVLELEFASSRPAVLSTSPSATSQAAPPPASTRPKGDGAGAAQASTPQAASAAGAGKPAAMNGGAAGLRRVEIALNSGSIADVSAPAYVVGVFEHINPTGRHGGALAIDEKLGGMLSTMVQAGMFESRLGEISLVPMPHDRSLTGLIAFTGLGAINSFAPSVLEIVGEKLAVALTKAHVLEFATVPVGTGTGLTVRDFLGGFLTGFVRGLSNSKDGANFRKISICEIDAERNDAIHQEMKALSNEGFFAKMGYEIVLSKEGAPVQAVGGVDAVTARPASPVYLQVQRMAETTFEYCILAAELGAAIQLHQQTIDMSEQARAADMAAKLQQFDATTGSSLASVYVPAAMQDLICRSLEKPTAHLVVIHDQASSTIPWEAFYFKDRCPALDVGVSRLYRMANRTGGAGRAILAHDATLRMLVVENPTGDLAGAQNEGEQLAELYTANRGKVTTLKGAEATRANVLTELSSGVYDILHYAGHADFVESSPETSGLILRDGRLTAADLLELGTVPQMIFLNACEVGAAAGGTGGANRECQEIGLRWTGQPRRELPAQRHRQFHRHVLAGERQRRVPLRQCVLRRAAGGQAAQSCHARGPAGGQGREPARLGQLYAFRGPALRYAPRPVGRWARERRRPRAADAVGSLVSGSAAGARPKSPAPPMPLASPTGSTVRPASRCAPFWLPGVLALRRARSGPHAGAAIATDESCVDERAA